MNRRRFVAQSMLGMIPFFIPVELLAQVLPSENDYFIHGVASGDATTTDVVIWTRINENDLDNCKVEWQVATDKHFKNIYASGQFITSEKRDYTVKVDVKNLHSDRQYYYRFIYKDIPSPTGRCRTLSNALNNPLRIAVVSCNNYEDGYFTSFSHIANNSEIDYVFHLGDYIYEYGTGEYGNNEFVQASNRVNDPMHEIVSLSDYRKRYALYRRDKDLQEVHQNKSFYCIWDDHELANNAYVEGAKNHQADEGKWSNRSKVAMQAYFEWMPVRANSMDEMIRSIKIGQDVSFYFLEERLDGRNKQLFSQDIEKYDPNRTMISSNQMGWLTEELESSETRWNFIINQVMFTGYQSKNNQENKEEDWWSGYPIQRNQLIKVFESLENPPIILTGDHHQSHVLELYASEDRQFDNPVAWEFLTPSITSKNDDRLSVEQIEKKKVELYAMNRHLLYNNTADHGYFILEIDSKEVSVSYKFNTSILVRDGEEKQGPIFKINHLNQLSKDV